MAHLAPPIHFRPPTRPPQFCIKRRIVISPAAVVEEDEVKRLVKSEVRRLPERERMVMSLYYDEGLTLADNSEHDALPPFDLPAGGFILVAGRSSDLPPGVPLGAVVFVEDGRIVAEPRAEGGSRFVVSLPAAPPLLPAPTAAPPAAAPLALPPPAPPAPAPPPAPLPAPPPAPAELPLPALVPAAAAACAAVITFVCAIVVVASCPWNAGIT